MLAIGTVEHTAVAVVIKIPADDAVAIIRDTPITVFDYAIGPVHISVAATISTFPASVVAIRRAAVDVAAAVRVGQ